MTRQRDKDDAFSRRTFLRRMRWAPVLLLPAPMHARAFRPLRAESPADCNATFNFADFRVTPHYPAKSPLDDILRKAVPGSDEFITEKYAVEIKRLLDEWSQALKAGSPAIGVLAKFLAT